MNQPWVYMCSPSRSPLAPPSLPDPSGSSQCTSPEHLSHASNLGWWSVSPLIIYMFWCCSLETSHTCLLPQSPKFCSIHLCLFFCFAYRVIITNISYGASLMAQTIKNLPVIQETWIRSLGREDSLEEGIPLQYSCLENLMDKGAWWAAVHGVTKSQTWLSD